VMFTDMVEYTALMQTDERVGLEKRDRYVRALENHHGAFDGRIVQRLGVTPEVRASSPVAPARVSAGIRCTSGWPDVQKAIRRSLGTLARASTA
jgi:class 3 adenylate cyclase